LARHGVNWGGGGVVAMKDEGEEGHEEGSCDRIQQHHINPLLAFQTDQEECLPWN
jgi:hypothetical protein